jgi:2-(3-amino-3-carboxypropyl)histidine synthase
MVYSLEIEKVICSIKKSKPKRILLQLPDGLKPKAKEIQEMIMKEANIEVFIWAGSCFGACDTPILFAKKADIDLFIQWGHAEWK